MRVLSVLVAILIWSFVFSHSVEAKIFKWVDENGSIHYSDKPSKKLKILKKLKNTKAQVSSLPFAFPKPGQRQKNDRKDLNEAAGRLINLKGRINTCQDLPGKIEHCEPYTCKMSHPIFDVLVIGHSISGMKDDKCHYEQTMPNNGLMTCNFSSWQRKQYAQLKREMFSSKTIENETSMEMKASFNMDTGGGTKLQPKIIKEEKNYIFDDKETEKLFNEAIENGNCMIDRY